MHEICDFGSRIGVYLLSLILLFVAISMPLLNSILAGSPGNLLYIIFGESRLTQIPFRFGK